MGDSPRSWWMGLTETLSPSLPTENLYSVMITNISRALKRALRRDNEYYSNIKVCYSSNNNSKKAGLKAGLMLLL